MATGAVARRVEKEKSEVKTMLKKNPVVIFVLLILFHSAALSQIFGLPKPHGTDLASKTKEEIAGGQFTVYQYHSSLTQSQILQFYQDKLGRKGWSKMKLEMPEIAGIAFQDRVFNFVKGSEMLVLNFSPIKAEGRIFYSISVGDFPTPPQAAQEEESSTEVFKEPKPLDFAPVYPGSKQVDYRKIPSGVQVGYMANGGVEAIKGFYLQGMPQQGWSLSKERYIGEDHFDLSNIESDCPTCPKLSSEDKEVAANMNMQGVLLEFEQDSKSCLVNIVEIGGLKGGALTSSGFGDSIITILYHDKK